jgi:hypothetical protein
MDPTEPFYPNLLIENLNPIGQLNSDPKLVADKN